MMVRVSTLEAFRQFLHDEEAESFNPNIEETEAMRAGTAFHSALETATPGQFNTLEAMGYTFDIQCEIDLPLSSIREIRGYQNYGDLIVTGQLDHLNGKRIEDHKTTAYPNLERFIEGYQWRFYLDIFEADVFRWNIFTIVEVPTDTEPYGKRVYRVTDFNTLEMMRYPGLHNDCLALARQYYEFMREAA